MKQLQNDKGLAHRPARRSFSEGGSLGEGGFTLIELLIVVAIIGIIAAIAVPGLLRALQSGNEASAIRVVMAAAATCNGSAAPSQAMYFVGADPLTAGQTGTRFFASDHRGTIYFANGVDIANPIVITTFIQ